MAPIDNTPQPVKEIILRFLEGNASENDVAILSDWLKESKENRQYFDEVNTTFQVSVTLNRFAPQKTDDAWSRLSKNIETKKVPVRRIPLLTTSRYISFLKIAASVCLVGVSGFLVFRLLPKETVQQATIVRTATGNNTRILLPDSSVVWLNSNSTLEYPPAFGSASRDVVLKGEAFFDVRKGSKPFVVKTDNIQVHVKGTKFNVQAYKNQTIKTTLQEGKVELQVSGEEKIYSMQPGDQVILDTRVRKVTLKKVDPSDFSAWKEEKLIFENVMLGNIVSKLENRFGVQIELDSMVARRERLSMTIERESLHEVLDLIQLSSHLKVKKEKNRIILFE